MKFDYVKAYFVFALPAFNNLPHKVKDIHSKLIPLVGELKQGRDLNIPMTDAIKDLIESLTTKEIAELSRASYFVGHWKPGSVESVFSNTRGESWKISNCCDQVLRKRLNPPHNIQIHEGKLRVTFSNNYCWIWEEFGLATEENLTIFKTCQLRFNESTLDKSANKLKKRIGDLWNYDNPEENEQHVKYLKAYNDREEVKLRQKIANLVPDAEKEAIKKIEEAKTKTIALNFLMDNGFRDIDNVIYYSHTQRFYIGWRTSLTDKEKSFLLEFMSEFPFDYELK